MKKRLLLTIGIVAAGILALASPVYATNPPDSTPSFAYLHVNRNLITTGDMLIYGDYDIPYATVPTDAASVTYMIQILNGSTVLGSVQVYPFFDNGYNLGEFSMYFTSNITWGTSYTLRCTESPVYFTSPTYFDSSLPTSAYSSFTTQADNQNELASNVILAAQRLQNVYTSYSLLSNGGSGSVLSSPTGETYFRGAIYGLQAMAPSIFSAEVINLDTTAQSWNSTAFDNYQNRWSGTWWGTSQNATGTQFGMTGSSVLAYPLVLLPCIGAIVVSSIAYKRAEPGYIACFIIVTMGVLMDWFPRALYANILQFMSAYIGYLWFYSRG